MFDLISLLNFIDPASAAESAPAPIGCTVSPEAMQTAIDQFVVWRGPPISGDEAFASLGAWRRWVEWQEQSEALRRQISALEATITNRRLREAALTDAGKTWLTAVDAQIAALRGQL